MKFSMRFDGGAELAAVLNALPPRVAGLMLREALVDGAEPMRARMRQLAPHAPGAPDLRENIGISATRRIGSVAGGRWEVKLDSQQAVAVGPTRDFFWGIYQEFGTVHHGAQPFMRPSFDTEAPGALAIIAQRLWTALAARGISRSVSQPMPVMAGGGGRNL